MSTPQPIRDIRGTSVPAIGYGTWELEGDDCFTGVLTGLELGYRHIDTAQAYGNEELVGAAITASGIDRSEVFLTTKVWNEHLSAESVKASVGTSLSKLQTDYVDLLVLHWPLDEETWPARLGAMADLVEHGAVRHLGVSNFTPPQLERALDVAPIFNVQVEHHPYLAQPGLLELAAKHDLLFTAYSPLARGEALHDPVITGIAEARDATPVQVVLRWLLDESEHLAVIPKATGREHAEDNLGAANVYLDEADREAIAALDRNERQVDPPWAPAWER
ncbi:aldo/keto reductase [Aquihabitans sp. G128]|uniref:aldo/keto reductase n=1 Tax=Aquihabitans sp. G128 TaxID=2849779 RepID=UPI001C24D39C|nr:aldo/keto reductase [Aquihabitans sp. G128]QXC62916.1 aldo/keto reductase [Aquihabitans sp. G128]